MVKLSVAMCTYNGALHLREQLSSIAAQVRLPDELVVCDDRSSDDTVDVLETFASTAPFPVRTYINPENLGSTKNFEKAIKLCDGEVIALSDQDDVWHPQKLQRMESMFSRERKAGLVFSDAEVVSESLCPLNYSLWQGHGFGLAEQKLFQQGSAVAVLLRRNFITGATMAFRSEFKKLILPIPLDMTYLYGHQMIHDGWIALMIAAVADLAFTSEKLIRYRQHRQQQLGVGQPVSIPKRKLTKGEWWEAVRQNHLAAFADESHRLGIVYERLLQNSAFFGRGTAMRDLEAQINHVRRRANMRQSGSSRVRCVLSELVGLRYHRYSNGVRSAVKDLLL